MTYYSFNKTRLTRSAALLGCLWFTTMANPQQPMDITLLQAT